MSDTQWSIQLFGGLRVTGPGVDVSRFPTKRSGLILARIALSRNGSASRDELADTLWPDDFLESTRVRLRQELNRLRETLGPAGEIIEADRSWIKLDFEKVIVDVREFERLLARGQEREHLARAVAQYEGPLLPEQSEEWVLGQRQEYQGKFLTALNSLTEDLLNADEKREALTTAMRAIRSDPYHEASRFIALRTMQAIGDTSGALRIYSEYEKAILKEFGTSPSERIKSLASSIRREASKENEAAPLELPTPPAASVEPSAPLPTYLDSIIGRESEIATLRQWLVAPNGPRLITMSGPGGVGKTRLAITAASSAANHFNGDVFFIGLADIEPGQSVISKVQKAFHPQGPTFTDDPMPSWGDRPCLLILDNAEHVLDEARAASQRILVEHSRTHIVITSRQKLGLGGEQELPVLPLKGLSVSGGRPSLDESPAAQLFIQRARSVRPGYNLPEDQIENLALLIERLDGLPLSIELAAARITAMTATKMLEEIDDRFTFLVSRRSDVSPRHRSLRATIEWSFQGLRDELRDLMEVLAMFRSGWTLELAQRASGRQDIYEALQDLMECSLIFSDESKQGLRFGMLEAIREYVLSNLSDDDAVNLRNVHCGVIAKFAVEQSKLLTGPEQNRIFDLIGAEMDNARAAIEWAVVHKSSEARNLASSLWRFWCARGKPSEGAELMDRLIATMPETPHDDWGVACNGRGVIAFLLGDDETCALICDRAAKIFDQVGNLRGVSWARYTLSRSLLKAGKTKQAEENLLFVLENGLPEGRHITRLKIAEAYLRMDQPEHAMALAEEGFAGALNHNDLANRAVAHAQLAEIYAACGRHEGVHSLLLEALERQQVAPVQDYKLFMLIGLAREELRQGRPEECREACEQAYRIAEDMGDHNAMITVENFRAQVASLVGSGGDLEHYESALRFALPLGGGFATMGTVRLLAAALAKGNRVDEARHILALEEGLREHLGTGLTLLERQHLEEALGSLRPLPSVPGVETTKQLAAKSLAILKGIPLVAAV